MVRMLLYYEYCPTYTNNSITVSDNVFSFADNEAGSSLEFYFGVEIGDPLKEC